MNIDPPRQKYIQTIFGPLDSSKAARSFPRVSALSDALEKQVTADRICVVSLRPHDASLFGTAAVDAWMRSVHSFLISASLTYASPIWSSVAGYYSSHYSIRAIAHLLGVFLLYKKRRIARVDVSTHTCTLDAKNGGDREHKVYWKAVKSDPHFASDEIFTTNDTGTEYSDIGHRDMANYADHLGVYPAFRELKKDSLKASIEKISQFEITAAPIPSRGKFPDLLSVQLVAYHRLVRFREMLDEAIGTKNRFWATYRTPDWTEGVIDFQIAAPRGLASIGR